MKVVDLHSDLFTDIAWRRSRGEQHVFDRLHYPQLKAGLIDTIICVFWVEPEFRKQPLERMRTIYRHVTADLAESKHARLCLSLEDAALSPALGQINVVLGLEGISFLATDMDRLADRFTDLQEKSVRHMILAWNETNSFASGTGADVPAEKPGLTKWGKAAVDEANERHWIVDVSHLDEASFWDLYHHSGQPITASHSNARAICDHTRNLTDDQLKAIASTGGIVGLNAYWQFIDPANPTVDRFIDHAIHITDLIGIESLGFGFDFLDYLAPYDFGDASDGKSTAGLENVTKIPALLERMSARGFTDKELEAICYHNAIRVLSHT